MSKRDDVCVFVTEGKFRSWKKEVDRFLTEIASVTASDLADYPAWDLFDDEVQPKDAACICLEEYNNFPVSEFYEV